MKYLFTLLFLIAGFNQFSNIQAASAFRADNAAFEKENKVNLDKDEFQFSKKISKKQNRKAKKQNRFFNKLQKKITTKTKKERSGLWVLVCGLIGAGLVIGGFFLTSALLGPGLVISLIAFIGGIVELATGNSNNKVVLGMLLGGAFILLPILAILHIVDREDEF